MILLEVKFVKICCTYVFYTYLNVIYLSVFYLLFIHLIFCDIFTICKEYEIVMVGNLGKIGRINVDFCKG